MINSISKNLQFKPYVMVKEYLLSCETRHILFYIVMEVPDSEMRKEKRKGKETKKKVVVMD